MGNDRVKEAADIVEAMSTLLRSHKEMQQQLAAIEEKKNDWQKWCSFCGKRKSEVGRLVTSHRVSICNECVVECQDVLADGAEHPHGAAVEAPPAPVAGSPSLVDSPFRAVHVSFDTAHLFVHLAEGTVLRLPLAYSSRLLAATQEQRESWRSVGGGIGVHWDLVDEDLSIVGMLCYARGYLKGAMDVLGYEESDALEDRYLSGCADAARLDPRPAVPYEEIAPAKHADVEARPTWDPDGGRPVGLGTEAGDLVGLPTQDLKEVFAASADRVSASVDAEAAALAQVNRLQARVNYLDERMNWIANASGYEDLEDYHAFVEKTAHEALAHEYEVPQVPSDSPFEVYVDKDAVGEITIVYRPATVFATGKTIEEAFALLAQEVRDHAERVMATPDEQCAPDLLALKRWFKLVPLGEVGDTIAWLHYQCTMRALLDKRAARGKLPVAEESGIAAELDGYWQQMTDREQDLAEQMFGWHEHYFSPLCRDEVHGRFDAVEDATGEIYMLDVGSGKKTSCRSREEAVALAKAAARDFKETP